MKHSCYIALVALILALPGLLLISACSVSKPEVNGKAAIIDQLCTIRPNETFISEVTRGLEDYGFQVDIYQGDAVTVDLFRKLPACGYKLVIFRVHSGLLGGKDVAGTTWLYTSEP